MRRALPTLIVLALLAAPAHAADPVVVAAGDVACDPASTGFNSGNGTAPPAETPGRCHMKATGELIDAINPGYVLGIGDLQNDNGALSKFQQSYDPAWGRFMGKTYPVPGNHEYMDDEAVGFFDYFGDRLEALGVDSENPQGGWYSLDIPAGSASWHVVAINSECAAEVASSRGWLGGCEVGSAQERWLRADLAANRSQCTLAFWHHPLYSSGGDGVPVNSGDSPQMKPIWNALYADYADIVLAGHRQNYERMAPQDPDGVPRPGRGIREWVVGTGGERLHTFPQPAVPPKPASQVRNNTRFGVLKLTLHGPASGHPRGWYEWQFAGDATSGSSFTDSGSGDCVGPPVAAPPAPPKPRVAQRDTTAPRITRPRLSKQRFRVGRRRTPRIAAAPRGTTVAYTVSEPATVTLSIKRKGKRRRAGVLERAEGKGRQRVRFTGRIGRRALRRGRYRLTLVAQDAAGNRSKPRTLSFRIAG